jgi:hypothetical protein
MDLEGNDRFGEGIRVGRIAHFHACAGGALAWPGVSAGPCLLIGMDVGSKEGGRRVARSGNTVAMRELDIADLGGISHVLGFTGNLIYLATTQRKSAPSPGVLVLRADDLSEVARYSTPEVVRSMAGAGTHLAVGAISADGR